MTSKTFSFHVLPFSVLLLMAMMGSASVYAASPAGDQSKQDTSAAGTTATDVRGTWSGTFFSKHSNAAPLTMTLVINAHSRGHLIATSSSNWDALECVQRDLTITG